MGNDSKRAAADGLSAGLFHIAQRRYQPPVWPLSETCTRGSEHAAAGVDRFPPPHEVTDIAAATFNASSHRPFYLRHCMKKSCSVVEKVQKQESVKMAGAAVKRKRRSSDMKGIPTRDAWGILDFLLLPRAIHHLLRAFVPGRHPDCRQRLPMQSGTAQPARLNRRGETRYR